MKIDRAIVAFALFLFVAPLAAQTASYPAFTVVSPAGASTPGEAIAQDGQWVLVYVFPGAASSDRLVQWLGEHWSDAFASHVVFVASGPPDDAKSYFASKGGTALASGARWYADPQGSAWASLRYTGTLAVAGMIGTRADWKVDGVIEDPSVVEPTIAKWCGQ